MRAATTRRGHAARFCAMIFALALAVPPAKAADPEPIKIGFGEALTGSLAVIGKSGIVAMQIWAEEINAKGGDRKSVV